MTALMNLIESLDCPCDFDESCSQCEAAAELLRLSRVQSLQEKELKDTRKRLHLANRTVKECRESNSRYVKALDVYWHKLHPGCACEDTKHIRRCESIWIHERLSELI